MIEINGLKFTYPGIDGHPPPGSTPLIEDFSLSLHSGDRCLLVGSNGAGLFCCFFFHTLFFSLILLFVWFPRKWREMKSKLEIEILMYWFLGSIIMGFVQFLFFSHSEFPWISVYLPRKWRKGKYKIGNRDFDGVFLGLNYNGARSICILFHFQSFLYALLTLTLCLVAEKMEGKIESKWNQKLYCLLHTYIVMFLFYL